jgi:hypothetical protein
MWLLLAGLPVLAAGCSGGGSAIPEISPRQGANQALADYDANKDGALDAKELDKCPALKAGMARVDKDRDGRLTADELADRLAFLQGQGSLSAVTLEVLLDNRPLVGATVTLVPEKFMGATYKPATAVTGKDGSAALRIEGDADDAIPLGYYRIEVSKKDGGQEQVPARYNTQTTLGHEVAPDAQGRSGEGSLLLRLTRSAK